jgi:hypothetical protein
MMHTTLSVSIWLVCAQVQKEVRRLQKAQMAFVVTQQDNHDSFKLGKEPLPFAESALFYGSIATWNGSENYQVSLRTDCWALL